MSTEPTQTQNISQTEEVSKKRPREEEGESEEPAAKVSKEEVVEGEEEEEDEARHFIHWRWLTVDVLKKCVSWSAPKVIPKKCTVVWMNFNFDTFVKECPDHPPILPRGRKLFVTQPFLKASFGYSPHMTANGVQNNMRLLFGEWVDTEAAEFYQRSKEWDEWFVDELFAHKDTWPLKIKLEAGETLKRPDVAKKCRRICRDAEKDGIPQKDFPQYMSLKFVTPRDDKKKNIKADPYTAHVTVWNGAKEFVTDILTKENGVPSDEDLKEEPSLAETRKIIIGKGDYCQAVAHWQKLYFAADFGPTLMVDELLFDTDENMRKKKDTKKVCPF